MSTQKTELTYTDEKDAQAVWEMLQAQGSQVSLIAYDAERQKYAFDYWEGPNRLAVDVAREAHTFFQSARFDHDSSRFLRAVIAEANAYASGLNTSEGRVVSRAAVNALVRLDGLNELVTTAVLKDPVKRLKNKASVLSEAGAVADRIARLVDGLNELFESED